MKSVKRLSMLRGYAVYVLLISRQLLAQIRIVPVVHGMKPLSCAISVPVFITVACSAVILDRLHTICAVQKNKEPDYQFGGLFLVDNAQIIQIIQWTLHLFYPY